MRPAVTLVCVLLLSLSSAQEANVLTAAVQFVNAIEDEIRFSVTVDGTSENAFGSKEIGYSYVNSSFIAKDGLSQVYTLPAFLPLKFEMYNRAGLISPMTLANYVLTANTVYIGACTGDSVENYQLVFSTQAVANVRRGMFGISVLNLIAGSAYVDIKSPQLLLPLVSKLRQGDRSNIVLGVTNQYELVIDLCLGDITNATSIVCKHDFFAGQLRKHLTQGVVYLLYLFSDIPLLAELAVVPQPLPAGTNGNAINAIFVNTALPTIQYQFNRNVVVKELPSADISEKISLPAGVRMTHDVISSTLNSRTTEVFAVNKEVVLCVVGRTPATFRPMFFETNLQVPNDGYARIRVIHAAHGTATSVLSIDGLPWFSRLRFGLATSYLQLETSKSHDLLATQLGVNSPAELENVPFKDGFSYSVVFYAKPDSDVAFGLRIVEEGRAVAALATPSPTSLDGSTASLQPWLPLVGACVLAARLG